MKLLATADIHGSQYRLNIILKNIVKHCPDLVVICGDITQFGPGEVAKNFLDQIPVDTFAIPGNIDTPDVNESINESKAININLKRVVKNKVPFVGIGSKIPSPLIKTTIHYNDIEKSIGEAIDNTTIFVTHEPPYKTQDRVFFGHHSGSKELRKLIEKCKPRLVLCGHIHEDPGISKVNDSIIINCSMGKRTEGALIKINDNIDVIILN